MLVGRPHRKHVVRPSTLGAGAGLGGGGIKPHGVAGAVGRGPRGMDTMNVDSSEHLDLP